MMLRIIGVVLLGGFLLGCDNTHKRSNPYASLDVDFSDRVTIQQGVWGDVFFWEGDFSLTYNTFGPSGTITPAVRTIYVFEPTTKDDVEHSVDRSLTYGNSYSFYTKIRATLVDSVMSDETGLFQLSLRPGQYSLFLRESTLFYSPNVPYGLTVLVEPNVVMQTRLNIKYKSAS